MTDKRVVRRAATTSIGVGMGSALSRRNGRQVATPQVVEYFGDEEAQPIIDLLRSQPVASQAHRGGDNVHVSDVISKCLRKIALMHRMNMRHPQEPIRDGLGITFAIGEAVHDYVKGRVTKGNPDKVYAEWSCVCRDHRVVGTFAEAQKKGSCHKCGTSPIKHNELSFVQDEYSLQGAPDLLLRLPDYNAFYITEIKSISAAQFAELVRPIPDHVVQVSFYWNIMRACNMPLVDKASILYANKEYSFKMPFKEYTVVPSQENLTIYYDDLAALKAAKAGGPLPMRVVCSSDASPEAKKCPVCVSCFGCE